MYVYASLGNGALCDRLEKGFVLPRAQNFGAGGMRSFEHRVEARRGVVVCLPVFSQSTDFDDKLTNNLFSTVNVHVHIHIYLAIRLFHT